MIEDPHTGSTNPGAHPSHVLRPLQAGADLLARAGVDGERISALHREEIHVGVCLLEDAVHPMVVGKISAERLTTGLCPLTGSRIRFDVPNTRSGGGRCAARSAVALVDQDDVCTGLGRAQRCPRAGGATTDHQYIGGEFEDVRHWPAPVRGLRNTSVAAIFLERTTQRHSQNHCELNRSLRRFPLLVGAQRGVLGEGFLQGQRFASLGDVAGLSLCNTSTSMLDHSFTNDAGNVRARELLEGL